MEYKQGLEELPVRPSTALAKGKDREAEPLTELGAAVDQDGEPVQQQNGPGDQDLVELSKLKAVLFANLAATFMKLVRLTDPIRGNSC